MPTPARVVYADPFSAKLVSPLSVPLAVSEEQKIYVKKILDKCASDTQFAEKAYRAIELVLTGGYIKVPTLSSLTPSSAEIGDPNFTVHIHGTNFTNKSKIIFNGYEEPTTYVSANEVSTGVNMSVWAAPAVVPVGVQTDDGVMSNTMNFTFTDGSQSESSFLEKKMKLEHAEQGVPKDPRPGPVRPDQGLPSSPAPSSPVPHPDHDKKEEKKK
jgi:hypothetical protein